VSDMCIVSIVSSLCYNSRWDVWASSFQITHLGYANGRWWRVAAWSIQWLRIIISRRDVAWQRAHTTRALITQPPHTSLYVCPYTQIYLPLYSRLHRTIDTNVSTLPRPREHPRLSFLKIISAKNAVSYFSKWILLEM